MATTPTVRFRFRVRSGEEPRHKGLSGKETQCRRVDVGEKGGSQGSGTRWVAHVRVCVPGSAQRVVVVRVYGTHHRKQPLMVATTVTAAAAAVMAVGRREQWPRASTCSSYRRGRQQRWYASRSVAG